MRRGLQPSSRRLALNAFGFLRNESEFQRDPRWPKLVRTLQTTKLEGKRAPMSLRVFIGLLGNRRGLFPGQIPNLFRPERGNPYFIDVERTWQTARSRRRGIEGATAKQRAGNLALPKLTTKGDPSFIFWKIQPPPELPDERRRVDLSMDFAVFSDDGLQC